MQFLISFYIGLYIICAVILLRFFAKKDQLFDYNKACEEGNKQFQNLEEIRVYKERKKSGISDILFGAFLSLFGFFGFGSIGRNIIDLGDSFVFNVSVMLVFVLSIIWGGKLLIVGRQKTEPSAEIVIKYSIIPPILYLRNFSDDENITYETNSLFERGLKFNETIETQFTKALKAIGPLIAIGRPKEELPTPGASRSYFTDEEWFEKFKEYMNKAQLIIVSIDFSDGLSKEINEILQTKDLKKTIFYLPLKKISENRKLNDKRKTDIEIYHSRLVWATFINKFEIKGREKAEVQLMENSIYQFLYFDKELNPAFYKLKHADLNHIKLEQLSNLKKDFLSLINVLEKN